MSRRSSGWVPNQHGAWAMLALPFLLGVVRGMQDGVLRPAVAALFGVWFVGYFAFFSAGLWLKSRRRPRYVRSMVTYGRAAGLFGILVLLADAPLVVWGPIFVPFLALGLWAAAQRTERSVLSGGVMVAAASLMTLVVYTACRGDGLGVFEAIRTGPAPIAALALLVFGYFFGTVLYVKSLIRERGVRAYTTASIGYHMAITMAAIPMAVWHDTSWWMAAGFLAAMTARAWAMAGRRPTPKALGMGEMVSSLALLVLGTFLH